MSRKRQRKQLKRARKQRKRAQRERTRPEPDTPRAKPDAPRPELPAPRPEDAWRGRLEREAVERARGRLRNDPQCVEAYFELADMASASRAEEAALMAQAVEAGESRICECAAGEALGAVVERTWETGPAAAYVIARSALADLLLLEGRVDEALEHYRTLLEWIPEDPVGVRVRFCSVALEAGRHAELEDLCARYADEPLCWRSYSLALLAYARGDSDADDHLQRALAENPHAAECLLDEREAPAGGGVFDPGSPDEAVGYARTARGAWAGVDGALGWLHERAGGSTWVQRLLPDDVRTRLLELPASADTWTVGWRRLPGWIEGPGGGYAPVVGVVVSADGSVLATEAFTDDPLVKDVWALCRQAMEGNQHGRPGRPLGIRLPADDVPALSGVCQGCGTQALSVAGHTAELDACLDSLCEHMSQGQPDTMPAWTLRPGVKESHVRALCAAAVGFFGRTPWQTLTGNVGFVLRAADPYDTVLGGAAPCAVVMGAGGETFGLALYDSVEHARAASQGHPPRRPPPVFAATVLSFDPPEVLNPQDRALFGKLGLERPGRDVWPLVMRTEAGHRGAVAPTPRQVEQLELALCAIPARLLPGELEGVRQVRRGSGEQVCLSVERVLLDMGYSGATPEVERNFGGLAVLIRCFFERRPGLWALEPDCFDLAALLCAVPRSPLGSGYVRSWAAGITYARLRAEGLLGSALTAQELAEGFGVSKATASSKARAVEAAVAEAEADVELSRSDGVRPKQV